MPGNRLVNDAGVSTGRRWGVAPIVQCAGSHVKITLAASHSAASSRVDIGAGGRPQRLPRQSPSTTPSRDQTHSPRGEEDKPTRFGIKGSNLDIEVCKHMEIVVRLYLGHTNGLWI